MTQVEKNQDVASVNFDELRVVFKNMSGLYAAGDHLIDLPNGLSPDLQAKAFWLSRAYVQCGKHALGNAKMVLFHANNSFEGQDIAEEEAKDIEKLRQGLIEGETALNYFCQSVNCSLQLYELDPESVVHHGNVSNQQVMDIQETSMALTYGMMSVEQQTECLLAHAFGQNTNKVAYNLISVLQQNPDLGGFEALTLYGSREIAALCGALIAARLSGIPCLIEGITGLAALHVLQRETPKSISQCYWIPQSDYLSNSSDYADDEQWPHFEGTHAKITQGTAVELIRHYADLKILADLIKAYKNDILV